VNKPRLKIAYISVNDPLDRKMWSGSLFSIHQSLDKHIGDVDVLGPFTPKSVFFFGRLWNGIAQKFLGKRYDYRHSKKLAKACAVYFGRKLRQKKYDLIVAPAASTEIAFLQTNVPIVYISDATVKSSLNYHKSLSNLLPSSFKESLALEKLALEKSSLIALTSPWAVNSAINDFGIDPKRVLLLPFGANFEELPDASFSQNRKIKSPVKLLFVGVNWVDKGGPIAYDAFRKLLDKGIDVRMTICGCVPPESFKHEKIIVIPFLNKNIKAEREQLYKLFAEADFFILPTRFEAYGLVFCEASAYGLISLATNSGGVSGVVQEGVNGFLFDKEAGGEIYADKIISLVKDETQYKSLCLSSRKLYEEKLNWDTWAKKLSEALGSVIS